MVYLQINLTAFYTLCAFTRMIRIMSSILDQVFSEARTQALATGETLFHTGDPVQSVFLVRAGRIVLVRRNRESGASLFLHIAGPGMMLAEASVWSPAYHCDAQALDDAKVAVIPRRWFRAEMTRNTELLNAIAMDLAHALQGARLKAEIRSLPRLVDRLDAWLAQGNAFPERGRLQELAAELGVTREALHREMARRRKKLKSQLL
jgi:CRP-like cAMP-binding protein